MKRYHAITGCSLLFALVIFCLPTHLNAQSFAIGGGLSTPSDEINNVYNSDFVTNDDFVGNLLRQSSGFGFHVAGRLYLELDEELALVFGVGLHRFNESRLDVYDEAGEELIAVLQATQNIVPISVGLDYPVYKGFLGLYVAGDLQYNYIFNTIDIVRNDLAIPFADEPTNNRVGANIGAGIEVDLAALILDFGLRFNHANIIGKEDNEGDKTYLTFNLSVLFGEKTESE